MRTIKFRAWDKVGGVMKTSRKNSIRFDGIFVPDVHDVWNPNDFILIQFTGLLDKNGKEIFEGDVVLLPDSEIVPVTDEGQGPVEDMNHLSPIEFQDGCFGLKVLENSGVFHKGFWPFDSIFNGEGYSVEDLEIIGNIYENPDLIK